MTFLVSNKHHSLTALAIARVLNTTPRCTGGEILTLLNGRIIRTFINSGMSPDGTQSKKVLIMSNEPLTITPSLHQYVINQGLREHPALAELREFNKTHPYYMMQITPEQGQLMAMLARISGAVKTIEVGVFSGYSSLAVALALPDNGKIIACDISEEYTQIARKYWKQAGVDHKIDLRLAPASSTLQQLIDSGENNRFDMAFIDADKASYGIYYEQCLQLVKVGGLILIDNVLWNGRVIDEDYQDEDTLAIRAFNGKIHHDNRVDMMLLPISDGLTIAIKR